MKATGATSSVFPSSKPMTKEQIIKSYEEKLPGDRSRSPFDNASMQDRHDMKTASYTGMGRVFPVHMICS